MKVFNTFEQGLAVLRAGWHFRSATKLGKKVRIWGKPVVQNWGELFIADRVRLVSTIATTEIVVAGGGCLEIGESTFINYGCSIAASKSVQIGPACNIGTYVIIMDNNFHRLEPERRQERPESIPICIEENVWLGARVIVLPGVRIGQGSVIGAGSVVTKDIPERVVAAGVPARIIKQL
ncbi:MAG: acyltransferase [Candidatus Promineifilaceae bacterium]